MVAEESRLVGTPTAESILSMAASGIERAADRHPQAVATLAAFLQEIDRLTRCLHSLTGDIAVMRMQLRRESVIAIIGRSEAPEHHIERRRAIRHFEQIGMISALGAESIMRDVIAVDGWSGAGDKLLAVLEQLKVITTVVHEQAGYAAQLAESGRTGERCGMTA